MCLIASIWFHCKMLKILGCFCHICLEKKLQIYAKIHLSLKRIFPKDEVEMLKEKFEKSRISSIIFFMASLIVVAVAHISIEFSMRPITTEAKLCGVLMR